MWASNLRLDCKFRPKNFIVSDGRMVEPPTRIGEGEQPKPISSVLLAFIVKPALSYHMERESSLLPPFSIFALLDCLIQSMTLVPLMSISQITDASLSRSDELAVVLSRKQCIPGISLRKPISLP